MRRERLEHQFIDGKPEGTLLSVEHLKYQGTVDGKPSYAMSSLEKWKTAAIMTWVANAVIALAWFAHH